MRTPKYGWRWHRVWLTRKFLWLARYVVLAQMVFWCGWACYYALDQSLLLAFSSLGFCLAYLMGYTYTRQVEVKLDAAFGKDFGRKVPKPTGSHDAL